VSRCRLRRRENNHQCGPDRNDAPESNNPRLPVTPEEIAGDALEAGKLGAAIVHLHARDIHEEPTPEPSVYAEITQPHP